MTATESVNLSELPGELEADDAVERHYFADVPGTTLSVYFDHDADAFDVSRVLSVVDRYGYDVDRLSHPTDVPPACARCEQGVDDASEASGVAEDADYWCRECGVFLFEDDTIANPAVQVTGVFSRE